MVFETVQSLLLVLLTVVTGIVSAIGYPGIFVLMTLESAGIPIPSEAVMPFAGYLASQGIFTIWIVVLVGSLANVVGSLLAYYLSVTLGRKIITRYGHHLSISDRFLILSEEWFKKYGEISVFFGRMLPVVRTFISIPAGIGKMNLSRFIIYTFIGSVPWNFALTYAGYWLGKNWDMILRFSHWIDVTIIAIIIVTLLYVVIKKK